MDRDGHCGCHLKAERKLIWQVGVSVESMMHHHIIKLSLCDRIEEEGEGSRKPAFYR